MVFGDYGFWHVSKTLKHFYRYTVSREMYIMRIILSTYVYVSFFSVYLRLDDLMLIIHLVHNNYIMYYMMRLDTYKLFIFHTISLLSVVSI